VGIKVANLERAISWYEGLGFVLQDKPKAEDWHSQLLYIAKMKAKDASGMIELIQSIKTWPNHFALTVHDVSRATQGLWKGPAKGIAHYAQDPSGNVIEFVEEEDADDNRGDRDKP